MPAFLLLVGFIVLLGVWAYARRGTFVGVCGITVLLIAPLIADGLTVTQASFDTWLWTFRLIGLCVFFWGLIENLTEVLRPTTGPLPVEAVYPGREGSR